MAVVGGGQAGLAIGYNLAREGQHFVILEAADSIGAAWRTRWDSLVLFTPRRYSVLAGMPFPGDPNGYPTRDEVLAYLEEYAEAFKLPVRLNTPVRRLSSRDGGFVLELDEGHIVADQVVVATGPFQVPLIPAVAGELSPEVFRSTAPATCSRAIFPLEPFSWSEAETRGTRSRRSSRRRTASASRWDRGKRRCRSGSSAATSSGGSPKPASSRRPSRRESASACSIATRSSGRARARYVATASH